ncbi:MAG: endolytic transglycosylase MltG [Rickettsiales bacterium]|jgi:UPF0755 protein|nr:endolytic transglycosylase MltG [Rickettsiales bacterium]
MVKKQNTKPRARNAKKPKEKSVAVKRRVPRKVPKKTAAKKNRNPPQKIPARRFHFLPCVIGLAAVVLSVACYLLFLKSVVPFPRSYEIRRGVGVSTVARDLGQGAAFGFFVMLYGNKVMAGTYDFPAGASVWRLARMTTRGEVASASITIPEGLTVKQIENLLKTNPFLKGEIDRNYNDGELFPDTYVVSKGTGRSTVMDLMAKKMEQVKNKYADASVSFSLPSPLENWNDVITLASIVQKETAKAAEMPMVASVYLNRLRKKMRLQADPTVVYAITGRLGDMREKPLLSKHLRIMSPYNTYRNKGLPPAPIANVGIAAIKAVLFPADTNYYYFVADGTGGHTFSRTLEEHNQKRSVWQTIKRINN